MALIGTKGGGVRPRLSSASPKRTGKFGCARRSRGWSTLIAAKGASLPGRTCSAAVGGGKSAARPFEIPCKQRPEPQIRGRARFRKCPACNPTHPVESNPRCRVATVEAICSWPSEKTLPAHEIPDLTMYGVDRPIALRRFTSLEPLREYSSRMRVNTTERPVSDGPGLWLPALGLAFLVACTWFLMVTKGHPWGDDWAGYLMQARALANGAASVEVATNATAISGSDFQLGPDAYPWGYPALLAIAGIAADWDFESMKWVGLVSLVASVIGALLLARSVVGTSLAVLVALCVGLRPSVIVDSTYLGSDLPFLALSTLALALIVRAYLDAKEVGFVERRMLLGVALLSVAAFSIRSNGVVLPATALFALGMLGFRGHCDWRETLAASATCVAGFGLGVVLYFGVLPDGSLSSLSYISLDPGVWLQACIRHVNHFAALVTFDMVRGPSKLLPLAVFSAICVLGLLRKPAEVSILLVYLALHVGLITLVPFDGGTRYYYPMLPAALVVFAVGLQALAERAASQSKGTGEVGGANSRLGIGAVLVAAFAVALALLSVRESERYATRGLGEPFSVDTRQVFRYVEANAPADARIAFFKPRAFRYATGRVAVAIRRPRNLERVDWYVFSTLSADRGTQLDERYLTDPASGFSLRYSVGTYRVYARTRG
jgi:hypothetical protein